MTTLPRYSSGSSPFPAVKEGDLFYTTVHARNIALVRKLLEVVLPVSYSDDFYAKLPLTPQELTKLGGCTGGHWGGGAWRAAHANNRRVSIFF
jgi:hypothetical protein